MDGAPPAPAGGVTNGDVGSGSWLGMFLTARPLLRRYGPNDELTATLRFQRNLGFRSCRGKQRLNLGTIQHAYRFKTNETSLLSGTEKNLLWIRKTCAANKT